MKDYNKSIIINKPASAVYAAITGHIQHWWSNDLTGTAAHTGDSFTISFGETRKTFNIEKATPDKQVIWKCVKAHIDMRSLKNKAEWAGTRLIWTLSAVGQRTTLSFLHEGLNPDFECYDMCKVAWNEFLASLKAYLTTGKGKPFLKPAEGPSAVYN